MKRLPLLALAFAFVASAVGGLAATLDDRISEAVNILGERQGSTTPIPQGLLNGAKGIAIVKVTKAGLVVGGAGGQGIVLAHTGGKWTAPSCFNVSGGSFGAQVGFETKRFVLVINSDAALRLFTSDGDTKWDATAAGTLGADAVKESESQLAQLPIIVYQDTGGVFGGATFGGTSINVDEKENHAAYGDSVFVRDIVGGTVKPPGFAQRLYELLNGKR